MTIYATMLGRGYFPKELPPAFFTEDFARYATTQAGRAQLKSYKPAGNSTEAVSYRLARPGGGLVTRGLAIPHPAGFAVLAGIVAKHFRRLLKKAGASHFAKSRPVYALGQARAIRTLVKPQHVSRERAGARAGATHLLKVDISQYYPSLYTHAVGWAIDPKLRQKKYWQNKNLLGKQIDQALMDMQGKVSQGIPIGNDISFLLAELVLSQIDKALNVPSTRTFRWFDDYEVACRSRREAEEVLVRLVRLLDSFRLRPNPEKTEIIELPEAAGDGWQDEILNASKSSFSHPSNMVSYFDHAFRLRAAFPEQPVLMYAIGTLFKLTQPIPDVHRVAQSCITQSLLAEPGCAQKAFALLTFWELNNVPFDRTVITETIERLLELHESRGVSSDVTWAMAFSIQHGIRFTKRSAKILSRLEDDTVAIQSLHANSLGLTPGLSTKSIEQDLLAASCDGLHWLLLYEAVRQGFMPSLHPVVNANSLFADFLAKGVTFYRTQLPSYATLVHPGGAPEWVVSAWLKAEEARLEAPVPRMIETDLATIETSGKAQSDLVRELIAQFATREPLGFDVYE
jgi:hypothetical protein